MVDSPIKHFLWFLILWFLHAQTSALPEYLLRIPNGHLGDSPTAGIGCRYIGHTPCAPGETRNQFGLDFQAAGHQWTTALCQMDSDGDGVTNGHELGDPCCVWTQGNDHVLRTGELSHPGIYDNTTSALHPCCLHVPGPSLETDTITALATPQASPPYSSTEPDFTAFPTSKWLSSYKSVSSFLAAGEPEQSISTLPTWLKGFPADLKVTLSDVLQKLAHTLGLGNAVQMSHNEFRSAVTFESSADRLRRPKTFWSCVKRTGCELYSRNCGKHLIVL